MAWDWRRPIAVRAVVDCSWRELLGQDAGELVFADLDARGWDAVDIVIVSGDAYVDHAAFGPVLIGRSDSSTAPPLGSSSLTKARLIEGILARL